MKPRYSGKKLRKLRIRAGYDIREFAADTGIKKDTLYFYERVGFPERVKTKTIQSIVEVLDCRPEDLFDPDFEQVYFTILDDVQTAIEKGDEYLQDKQMQGWVQLLHTVRTHHAGVNEEEEYEDSEIASQANDIIGSL